MNAQTSFSFDGPAYDPKVDAARLVGLLRRVYDYMRDRDWHTVPEIAAACDGSETGTAAMLRKLRRQECGGHKIERRRTPGNPGLWQYRLEV